MSKVLTAEEWFDSEHCKNENLWLNIEEYAEYVLHISANYKKVNRVEVIDHSENGEGRAYTNYNVKEVEIQLQDNNQTMKVFIK